MDMKTLLRSSYERRFGALNGCFILGRTAVKFYRTFLLDRYRVILELRITCFRESEVKYN